MAKLFSFASWNVEHFKNNQARARRVAEFIRDNGDPDVFALFEVEGSEVFGDFIELMPTHVFFQTEGTQFMETLIGVRKGFTAFITQRHELQSDVPTLRPGALATLRFAGINYSLLFVHLKSSTEPRSWGLRDDMIVRIRRLKNRLDELAQSAGQARANFILLGDLNTMGVDITYSPNDLDGAEELRRYQETLRRNVEVDLIAKDAPHTFWNGPDSSEAPSDLDHVFASESLDIRAGGVAGVSVLGWPKLATPAEQQLWIAQHSDHAMLYGEVHV